MSMLKPSTQFLRNLDYAPSNPQVLAQHIQAQNSKSLPALIALNSQNDQAAAVNRHGLLQQGQQPTIAEREITEAMPQVAGIPAGGMPNAGGISPMAANGVGALRRPPPQPIDSGVLGLNDRGMQYSAAGGGLISLANGGLTDDEIMRQIAEQEALIASGEATGPGLESRWDQYSDWTGDVGSDIVDWAGENPIEAGLTGLSTGLMFVPGVGQLIGGGIKGGLAAYRGLTAAQKAKKLFDASKTTASRLVTKPNPKGDGFVMKGGARTSPSRIPGERGTRTFTKDIPPRQFAPVKTGAILGGGVLAGKGIEGIHDYLTDPRATPNQPVMAGTLNTAERLQKQKQAAEYLKKKKALEDAAKAGKGGKATAASEKGFLEGLGPATWLAGLTTATNLFSGEKVGTATEKGIATGLAVKKQELDRDKLKADEDYRDKSLKLEEKQMDLVAETARSKLGWSQENLEKAKAKYLSEGEGQNIANEVRKEIEEARPWFGAKLDEKKIAEKIRREQNTRFNLYLIDLSMSMGGISMLGGVNRELASR